MDKDTHTHPADTNNAEQAHSSRAADNHSHEQPRHLVGQMATKYVNMLLALDKIPIIHNILAAFFVWILLAGFILFPGTFTSLSKQQAISGSAVGRQVLNTVAHVPL